MTLRTWVKWGGPVTAASFRIQGPQDGRLTIALTGDFDVVTAENLEREVVVLIGPLGPSSIVAIFNLCELLEFTMYARAPLVRLQQALAKKARRTVYFADRARFRGLGLLIAHLAEDPNARAVMTLEQQEAWLAGSNGRVADAEARSQAAFAGGK